MTDCQPREADAYRHAVRKLASQTARPGVTSREVATELDIATHTARIRLHELATDDAEPIERTTHPSVPNGYLYYHDETDP